jgi:hypothetical protein
VTINKKRKFGTKIVDCVFLDYAIYNVGYRFLIINSIENEFSIKNTPRTSSHDSIFLPETHEPVIHADMETHEEIPEEDNNIVA